MVGAALGPVFSTCSPTYFVILATVLPASFLLGTAYLLVYVLGLALVLLGIALLGERLTRRLEKWSNPDGWFNEAWDWFFILLATMIIFGVDKKLRPLFWIVDI